jgi:hypothetical protein
MTFIAQQPRNTEETPLTHHSGSPTDHQWQWCKCNKCGTTAVCTPWFDFYVKSKEGDEKGKPFLCEPCFWSVPELKNAKRLPDEGPTPLN